MNLRGAGDPTYVAGRSEGEARRLERQAELFESPTRRLFEAAGISTGMKVLDLGSGAGDVAFLAAGLVGPTGRVVGVDLDPAVVATARARAGTAGLTQVSFIAGDIREVELQHDFDAVVGRFVLMYLADPIAGLRAALSALRDDGRAAFYEANMGAAVTSFPVSPLHQLLGRCVNETCVRGGVELAMGTKLYQVFLAAGMEAPQLCSEALIGGGRDWMERFAAAAGIPTQYHREIDSAIRSVLDLLQQRFGISSHACQWRNRSRSSGRKGARRLEQMPSVADQHTRRRATSAGP
jgi:SAM-dependent methyltransferase